jgi:transposase-like protein
VDVRDGYITPEMAEKDYGIVVDARSGSVRNVRSQQGTTSQSVAKSVDTADVNANERVEAILSIMRGDTTASAVALRLGVTREEVDQWIDQFLSAGERSMRQSESDSGDVQELRAMVRDLASELSSLRRSLSDRRS